MPKKTSYFLLIQGSHWLRAKKPDTSKPLWFQIDFWCPLASKHSEVRLHYMISHTVSARNTTIFLPEKIFSWYLGQEMQKTGKACLDKFKNTYIDCGHCLLLIAMTIRRGEEMSNWKGFFFIPCHLTYTCIFSRPSNRMGAGSLSCVHKLNLRSESVWGGVAPYCLLAAELSDKSHSPDTVHPNQPLYIEDMYIYFKWKFLESGKEEKEAPRSSLFYASCLQETED